MIAVIQRVTEASVRVDGVIVGQIAHGILALVAVHRDDTPDDITWMTGKLTSLRIFRSPDRQKHFDQDVRQIHGSILLISNFTVAAATKKGRRPSLDAAASPDQGRLLFDQLLAAVRATGIPTSTGQFAADMNVSLQNDGPATFLLNSKEP